MFDYIRRALANLRFASSRAFALSICNPCHKSVQARFVPGFRLGTAHCIRGDGEIRTHDPLLARQVLSQLSYTPMGFVSLFFSISSADKWA